MAEDIFDWKPDYGLNVPGDIPGFGSIYSDSEAAGQATLDWQSIVAGKLGKWVDYEFAERYAPKDQTPRDASGKVAGTVSAGAKAASLAPWLLVGGAVLLVLFLALRK